jgi:hypothetical protein
MQTNSSRGPIAHSQKNIQMHRIRDVERLLRCCRNTVLAHVREGRLKSIKIGGCRLITDTSLRELIEAAETAES